MTSSDNHIDGPALPTSLSRHDLVLVAIPLAFLFGLVATGLSVLSPAGGLTVSSAVGAVAVADALFLNPPAGGGRR